MGCSASIMKPIDMTSTPCARERQDVLAVLGLRFAAGESHHLRLAGAVDVGVQEPNARPLRRPGERQVRGGGRFAHPALSRGHRDDVLHLREGLQRSLDRVRGYGCAQLELDTCAAQDRLQMTLQGRGEFRPIIRTWKTEFELNNRHLALQGDRSNGLCLRQRLAQIGIEVGAQRSRMDCGIVGRVMSPF